MFIIDFFQSHAAGIGALIVSLAVVWTLFVTAVQIATKPQFKALDTKFEAIDARFQAVDTRFQAVETRLSALEQGQIYILDTLSDIYPRHS